MADRPASAPTAADSTREYIDEHPSIRLALRDELLNYTALAQKIQAERGISNEEAVTIACRRYERVLRAENPEVERVRAVLRGSRIEVHSRVATVRIRKDWEALDALMALGKPGANVSGARRVFQVFEGTQSVTALVEESGLPALLEGLPSPIVTAVGRGLTALVFRSRGDAEMTPGVLAVMAETLYQNGVNCVETASVHHDSILVFRDEDVIRAYQILSAVAPADAGAPENSPGRPRSGGRRERTA